MSFFFAVSTNQLGLYYNRDSIIEPECKFGWSLFYNTARRVFLRFFVFFGVYFRPLYFFFRWLSSSVLLAVLCLYELCCFVSIFFTSSPEFCMFFLFSRIVSVLFVHTVCCSSLILRCCVFLYVVAYRFYFFVHFFHFFFWFWRKLEKWLEWVIILIILILAIPLIQFPSLLSSIQNVLLLVYVPCHPNSVWFPM